MTLLHQTVRVEQESWCSVRSADKHLFQNKQVTLQPLKPVFCFPSCQGWRGKWLFLDLRLRVKIITTLLQTWRKSVSNVLFKQVFVKFIKTIPRMHQQITPPPSAPGRGDTATSTETSSQSQVGGSDPALWVVLPSAGVSPVTSRTTLQEIGFLYV